MDEFNKWASERSPKYYYDYFAHHEMFEHLEAVHALIYNYSSDLNVQMVTANKLNVLKWLAQHDGINWNSCTEEAIGHGYLNILKFIRKYCDEKNCMGRYYYSYLPPRRHTIR